LRRQGIRRGCARQKPTLYPTPDVLDDLGDTCIRQTAWTGGLFTYKSEDPGAGTDREVGFGLVPDTADFDR
jgi:hypothetical protein